MRLLLILVFLIAAAVLTFFSLQDRQGAQVAPPPVDNKGADSEIVDAETLAVPRFDLVRVDRNGYAVIAGQAAPGASVEVLANGTPVVTETAGADGAWAAAIDTPLAEGPVELALRMTTADGLVVTAGETVVIFVLRGDADAPVVLRTTAGGATTVLQGPPDAAGSGPLALEIIDYDAAGNVILAGRAQPGFAVQVYADDRLLGEVLAGEEGRWELSATLAPGRYVLRIIQISDPGKAMFVIEVPFVQAALEDIVLRDGQVIVQPGNNLWVIARRVYGAGAQYTVIYDANAAQIRDPDVIYPGQIFDLPQP